MKKMTKLNFIKAKKYIFTLGSTNLDLWFTVKGYGFGDRVSNFKKYILKISK